MLGRRVKLVVAWTGELRSAGKRLVGTGGPGGLAKGRERDAGSEMSPGRFRCGERRSGTSDEQ